VQYRFIREAVRKLTTSTLTPEECVKVEQSKADIGNGPQLKASASSLSNSIEVPIASGVGENEKVNTNEAISSYSSVADSEVTASAVLELEQEMLKSPAIVSKLECLLKNFSLHLLSENGDVIQPFVTLKSTGTNLLI
jgi:hypothetical protein